MLDIVFGILVLPLLIIGLSYQLYQLWFNYDKALEKALLRLEKAKLIPFKSFSERYLQSNIAKWFEGIFTSISLIILLVIEIIFVLGKLTN